MSSYLKIVDKMNSQKLFTSISSVSFQGHMKITPHTSNHKSQHLCQFLRGTFPSKKLPAIILKKALTYVLPSLLPSSDQLWGSPTWACKVWHALGNC